MVLLINPLVTKNKELKKENEGLAKEVKALEKIQAVQGKELMKATEVKCL